MNTFAFSKPMGWQILARFFDLIGPDNIKLLRHLSIVHPGLSEQVRTDVIEHFIIRQRSPFGMCDMPDDGDKFTIASLDPYNSDCLHHMRDPLEILRAIDRLRNLNLLVHYDSGRFSQREELAGRADVLTTGTFASLTWEGQPLLKITIVSMCPRRRNKRCKNATLSGFEDQPAPSPSTYWGEYLYPELIRIRSYIKEKGWDVKDIEWCHSTGVWPLEPGEPSPKTTMDRYVEDIVGFTNREEFELQEGEKMRGAWNIVGYSGCVVCWRNGGLADCTCDDRPTYLPPGGISTEKLPISNPGTEITVDVKKGVVSWDESYAVKDGHRFLKRIHGSPNGSGPTSSLNGVRSRYGRSWFMRI